MVVKYGMTSWEFLINRGISTNENTRLIVFNFYII
jgi:hypothetical protein